MSVEHDAGVAHGVHPSTGHSYRFAHCGACGWSGPNRRDADRAQREADAHNDPEHGARWRPVANHVGLVAPDGRVLRYLTNNDGSPTRYGTVSVQREAARWARERGA